MAVTESIAPAETAPIPFSAPKKKKGRPSNAQRALDAELAAKAARETAAEIAASNGIGDDDERIEDDPFEKPGRRTEDWFEWLSQTFNESDWNGRLMIYLWRTAPCIDRKAIGKATSICKYVECIDITRIMMDQGSGDYRLDLCAVSQPHGKVQRISQHRCSILNIDFPPKVPPGEWIDDPMNQNWAWAKPALEAAATRSSAAFNAIGATGMTLDPSQMFKTVADTFKAMQPPPAPAADQTLLTTLVTALVNRGPDQTLTIMQEQLKHEREENREYRRSVEARLNTPQPQPKGILEQIQELEPVIKLLGPKTRADKSTTADYLMQIGEKFIESAPALLSAWRLGTIGPGAFPPAATATVTAVPMPAPIAPTAAPNPEGESELQQISPEQQAKLQSVLQKHKSLIEGVAMHMIDAFKNETGYDFRDWFIKRKGIELYHELQADTGESAEESAAILTNLAQQHNYLRSQLSPAEKLQAFLLDFFTEPGEEPADRVIEEEFKETTEPAA